ncbi:ylmG homolog protein 1-2, chloroplastic [Alnus glutinosa]|uniref:ylmG homolog protein 1-2, chloroplastic n=1 Tax=Alnus glutinosa TaxID=3517 RepID=UPI002D797E4B|nr:ylmG homolog protein 1-2, chloroplastic [Alnus glutinosa]XP_062164040.1 ylmG homolog protein 1-2, chloroplastic [Alnus glutinosa]XP_062164041.1 ylmG homolog protein 1-2, chloroplastic [Alnus glutinosa]
MAPLMTSQAILVRSPLLLPPPNLKPIFHNPRNPFSLRLATKCNPTLVLTSASASSSPLPTLPPQTPKILSQSAITQILTTVSGIALFFATLTHKLIAKLSPKITEQVCLQSNLVSTVGPLFFAALKDRPSGYLNTPLTVVAAGLAKWLDIYSGVLMVRVLLSWFPNIPWERQPLSAIRDLCDPYLNLFRNIIPPIFDTLDVSPLLAFAVLGTLGSILNSSRGMY